MKDYRDMLNSLKDKVVGAAGKAAGVEQVVFDRAGHQYHGRIAAMADASYNKSLFHLERYEEAVLSAARALVNGYDAKLAAEQDAASRAALREEANTAIAAMLQEKAADTLDKVLFELSSQMKNAYSRSDA